MRWTRAFDSCEPTSGGGHVGTAHGEWNPEPSGKTQKLRQRGALRYDGCRKCPPLGGAGVQGKQQWTSQLRHVSTGEDNRSMEGKGVEEEAKGGDAGVGKKMERTHPSIVYSQARPLVDPDESLGSDGYTGVR